MVTKVAADGGEKEDNNGSRVLQYSKGYSHEKVVWVCPAVICPFHASLAIL